MHIPNFLQALSKWQFSNARSRSYWS